jgi:hypothetical protein
MDHEAIRVACKQRYFESTYSMVTKPIIHDLKLSPKYFECHSNSQVFITLLFQRTLLEPVHVCLLSFNTLLQQC